MKKNIVKIAYENDGSERNTRIEIEDEEMETAQITGWSIEEWLFHLKTQELNGME